MQEAIWTIVELGQQASALAQNAVIESARLREAQDRLVGMAAGMSVLAAEAAEVAAGFEDKPAVVESDLRPTAQMMVLLTGILKNTRELSEAVENTLQSQTEATQGLAASLGEAVEAGARIFSRIAALADVIQAVVPIASDKRKLEAELTHLAAELHDFVMHCRKRRKRMGTASPGEIALRLPGEPPSIN